MSSAARRLRTVPFATWLGLAALTAASLPVHAGRPPVNAFESIATFEVVGEVAEIVAATPDGRTLLYTDSGAAEVGIVDITDPGDPQPAGTVAVPGSPTSVAVTRDGTRAIVAVDTTDGDVTAPSGLLVVIDMATSAITRSIVVSGQPDAIAISPDGGFAAIAVENERDEDVADGALPQLPAGFLAVLDLQGAPETWVLDTVSLVGLAGLTEPTDPEPEFVDVNAANLAAVTLQENNAVVIVDLATRAVVTSWSLGTSSHPADTGSDDVINFSGTISEEREPDAIAWTPTGNLLTANEGDWLGGSRDFSIFTPEGELVFDAGASLELAAVDARLYRDGRSDDLGIEPEGAEIASYGSHTFAFIGAERADFVAVYRLVKDRMPKLIQLLETGSRPEGLLAIPSRDLFVSANEDDGTISIFQGSVSAEPAH